MLIYEVNLNVDRSVEGAFRAWLREHIDEVLKVEGFVSARVYERDPGFESMAPVPERDLDSVSAAPGSESSSQPQTSPSSTANHADQLLLSVHYQLKDRESFDHYITHHAPRMREDGLRRFGGKFTATRRVLKQDGIR